MATTHRLRPDPASRRVTASQWFKLGDHPAVTEIYGAGTSRLCGCGHASNEHGFLGNNAVCPGDWIVQDARGELARFKSGEFAELYEER